MRQRRVKNLEERLEALGAFIVEDGKALKGKWHTVFGNDNPIYLELGCGKGQFSSKQAQLNAERNLIAVEGQETVLLRAVEKASEKELSNIRFMKVFIRDITEYFDDGELAGIYLNFSDPWPKDRHAKRRLTHISFLKGYIQVLKDGGFVEFKTDNDPLFAFTLEQIENAGLNILECTTDLHNSEFHSKNITTEYEDKFRSVDKNINYVKFTGAWI